jgi:uncharacterized protein YecT (DUF1311 family)
MSKRRNLPASCLNLGWKLATVFRIPALLLLATIAAGQELPRYIWDPNMLVIQGRVIDGTTSQPLPDIEVDLARLNTGDSITIRMIKTDHDGSFRFERLAAYSVYLLTTNPALGLDLDDVSQKTRAVVRLASFDASGIQLQFRPQNDHIKVSDCGTASSTQSLEECLARAARFHNARVWARFSKALGMLKSQTAVNALLDSQRTWQQHRNRDCQAARGSAHDQSENGDPVFVRKYACELRLEVIRERQLDTALQLP